MDVGVTIVAVGTMAAVDGGIDDWLTADGGGAGDRGPVVIGGPLIDTGKNVDVFRSDVVDEFGDNGLKWYRWRFSVCDGFAGIKMWCVAPGTSGIGDCANDGRYVLLMVPIWRIEIELEQLKLPKLNRKVTKISIKVKIFSIKLWNLMHV